jgi:selenide, water dikinase
LLLVGPETADDAGVYLLGEGCALVETADIITPLVDDPFTFGAVAAANALSDVYAMGGKPLTAMNLVFFPSCTLPGQVLADILAGGLSKIREAGACLVGGHTVEDDELKYGLSVTGTVDPARVVRNSTARSGDLLILTKPLGTGIVSTAVKGDMAPAETSDEAVRWMTLLNREAADLMVQCGATACTDVTGFGLVGHALEMARGAGVTVRIEREAVPMMAGVRELVSDGMVPAGCYRNRDYHLRFTAGAGLMDDALLPLFDPQTSGGLLISFSPDSASRFLAEARGRSMLAVTVGEVFPMREKHVEIV